MAENRALARSAGSTEGGDAASSGRQSWNAVQRRVRATLGEDLYSSWFSSMEFEGLEKAVLTVSVPTRFLRNWVENHYAGKLRLIAAQDLGPIESLVIKVRNQAVTPQRPVVQGAPSRGAAVPAKPVVSPEAKGPNLQAEVSHEEARDLAQSQTFDTFMVGAANQLAHAAALRVASAGPSTPVSFNPLFIHAPSGLGKTHLLNAIANKASAIKGSERVLMLTAERFMYRFIQAIRQRDTIAFKDKFQSIDLLLIDDFQFLQGKSTQQEFGHAFNALVDAKRQIVIAADVPPAQLDSIEPRMRSRMMGGLVIDIDQPDEALRRKIIDVRLQVLQKQDPSFSLTEDVLNLVAERVTGGGRELEGALNRLFACQQLNNQPVTLELASMILRDSGSNGLDPGRVKIDDILKVVGRHYNVAKADLLSPRRARTVVMPRQIGMYLAKKLTSRSLPDIGRRFGGRDHSTVLHAVRKIDEQIKCDDKLAKEVALLIRLMEQM